MCNQSALHKKIKADFDLTPEKMKKVQFYTSETIILERSDEQQQMATTGSSGELVKSERSTSERIVIPANRPCVFEKLEDDGTVQIRFELGGGRVLRFAERRNISNGRYYLVAQWNNGKGELDYGGSVYYAVRGSSAAYLMVKLKNWKKNQRKDRVVKGMKV
ncbi:hypothetical protein CW751_00475 [Brumimicrobium salinarum]|uniref:Uncharacterized protein n=2 Tax=Brumimicrobium salinarum TaxID=2058658 RepID=A0A2I0R5I7_9FLAO|nr:hypothetical protein CW751_00475 [Brumimicrobium salinarum]